MTFLALQILAFWLLAVGVLAVVIRRSPLAVFMGIELMLNGAILLVMLGVRPGVVNAVDGPAAVLLLVALAAAEVAVGLAVMMAMFRHGGSADLNDARDLRG